MERIPCRKRMIFVIILLLISAVSNTLYAVDRYGFHLGHIEASIDGTTRVGKSFGVSGQYFDYFSKPAMRLDNQVFYARIRDITVLTLDSELSYHLFNRIYGLAGFSVNLAKWLKSYSTIRSGVTAGFGLHLTGNYGIELKKSWVQEYDVIKLQLFYFTEKSFDDMQGK